MPRNPACNADSPEESHKPEKAVGIPAGNESAANETAGNFQSRLLPKIQTGVTESADYYDYILQAETNIDDCSGEVLGFVMEKLLRPVQGMCIILLYI